MDEKQISELLECSVCLERFDQSCKVLPCQHTFCRQCLDEILLTKHELRCPECRALVTVRVADLPTNILVVRILEGLKTKNQGPVGSGGRHHHVPVALVSSPSKLTGLSPLHRHESALVHLMRQGTQPCAKALYNYESSEKDDLPLMKGDVIMLKRQIDENWYQGELNGKLGFFPANFVQVLVPLPQIPQCRALFDFELKDESEKDCLSFKKEEVLTVIRRVDENWLEGRKGDKIGIFPITFVELNDAARSLVNMKGNLTILPTSLSTSLPSSVSSNSAHILPHSTMLTSSSTVPVNSNRSAYPANSESTVTTPASTTTVATISTATSSTSTTASISVSVSPVSNGTAAVTSAPLATTTTSSSGKTSVLAPVEAVSSSASSAESAVSSTSSSSSLPVLTSSVPISSMQAEVPSQNKRHSYSPSFSSQGSHPQQRHSAEVTLETSFSYSVDSGDPTLSRASSLPVPTSQADNGEAFQDSTSVTKSTTSSHTSSCDSTIDSARGLATASSSSVQTGSLTIPLYVAMYNYKPQKDDELDLMKGEHYTVAEKCQDGWFKGACVNSGKTGVFPGNYVCMVKQPSAFKPVNPNVLNIRAKGPALSASVMSTSISSSDHRPAASSSDSPIQAPPLKPRVAKMNTPVSSLGLSRPVIPAPPSSSTSLSHHSLWMPPNLAAMQQTMSASANITPPNVVMAHSHDSPTSTPTGASGKDKKEKKEKEKKSLVKLLAGKAKKSKQAPQDAESPAPLSLFSFENVAHIRSGSYPSDHSSVNVGDTSVTSAHKKAASFDATTSPPVPAKPRPKLVARERYCCIVPYPPQTDQELALELGDIIHVHRKREDGWYKGTQERTGKTGMFPASFVEKCS